MLEQCLNEQAPIKKLSKAKQKLSHKPWITPCLLKSIKTKNRLYRALVHSGFSSQKYKKYRNKVTHLLEINKKSYYQSQFLFCRNDSGIMWKLINSLISSKEKSSCPPRETIWPYQIKLHKQTRSHVQYIQHLLCLNWTAISKQDSSPNSPYISSKS